MKIFVCYNERSSSCGWEENVSIKLSWYSQKAMLRGNLLPEIVFFHHHEAQHIIYGVSSDESASLNLVCKVTESVLPIHEWWSSGQLPLPRVDQVVLVSGRQFLQTVGNENVPRAEYFTITVTPACSTQKSPFPRFHTVIVAPSSALRNSRWPFSSNSESHVFGGDFQYWLLMGWGASELGRTSSLQSVDPNNFYSPVIIVVPESVENVRVTITHLLAV